MEAVRRVFLQPGTGAKLMSRPAALNLPFNLRKVVDPAFPTGDPIDLFGPVEGCALRGEDRHRTRGEQGEGVGDIEDAQDVEENGAVPMRDRRIDRSDLR